MKKVLVLIVGMLMAVSTAFASTTYLGVTGGVDVPISPAGGTTAFGGSVLGGVAVNENFAVQLNVDILYASVTGASVIDIRPLAEAKYSFGTSQVKPYVIGGLGLDMQFATAGSSSNFDGAAGAGVDIDLQGKATLFFEARYNMIFATGITVSDLPISAGLKFPLQ